MKRSVSAQTRKRMSIAKKRRWRDPVYRQHMVDVHSGKNGYWFGKHHSDETKQKLRKARLGKPNGRLGTHHSKETKQKIRDAQSGELGFWFGKHRSEETKEAIGNAFRGEKCHLWRGGISFLPYTTEFNDRLKCIIRKRDNYTCQWCSAQQTDRALSIHHIDYIKEHCDQQNLITLCPSCHTMTNSYQEFWTGLFQCAISRGYLMGAE